MYLKSIGWREEEIAASCSRNGGGEKNTPIRIRLFRYDDERCRVTRHFRLKFFFFFLNQNEKYTRYWRCTNERETRHWPERRDTHDCRTEKTVRRATRQVNRSSSLTSTRVFGGPTGAPAEKEPRTGAHRRRSRRHPVRSLVNRCAGVSLYPPQMLP